MSDGTDKARTKKQALVPLALGATLAGAVCAVVLAIPEPRREGVRTAGGAPVAPAGTVPGLDVRHEQGPKVGWARVAASGARFVYLRATRGDPYIDPYFPRNAAGARKNGLLQGAYHFAWPHKSTGAAQAEFFVNNGGGWHPDGRSLPGALALGSDAAAVAELPVLKGLRRECHNLAPAQTVAWIREFSDRYLALTGRRPVIYTERTWWNTCTRGSAAFAATHRLWLAEHQNPARRPQLPSGWARYGFWRFWDDDGSPRFPGGQDAFAGTPAQLRAFAARRDRPVADASLAVAAVRGDGGTAYTVQVRDHGPDGTGPLRLAVALPEGVRFVRASGAACAATRAGAICVWPKGLKTGMSGTFQIVVTAGPERAAFTLTTRSLDWRPANNAVRA